MPKLPNTYLGIYATVLTIAFAGLLLMGVLDPDGNNIEAVFHGPSRWAGLSVVIAPVDS